MKISTDSTANRIEIFTDDGDLILLAKGQLHDPYAFYSLCDACLPLALNNKLAELDLNDKISKKAVKKLIQKIDEGRSRFQYDLRRPEELK